MVGIYETAVDYLCQRQVSGQTVRPKYIASTATARRAEPQVQALFDRTLAQFPPPALSADERFFATSEETHPLDSSRSGRLYVGICAPGKGAQTPIVRIWSALLQQRGSAQGPVPPRKDWIRSGHWLATSTPYANWPARLRSTARTSPNG